MNKFLSSIFTDYKDVNLLERNNQCVICSDSLDVLPNIKDNIFNLIFADPPYNIGKKFGKTKEKWSKADYLSWCYQWIDECMRILKDNGVFCFMTATQFMPYLDCYISDRYDVFSRVIWHYDSSGVQSKNNFGSLYEPILFVTKSKDITFNREYAMTDTITGKVKKLIDYRKTPPKQYNTKKIIGNVWYIPRVRYMMDEYETHPTQKPEKLLERIIQIFTKENDLVLDPFAGTFTTCAIAKRLNRNSIGIEKEEEYYKIGIRRMDIADVYKGKPLVKTKKRLTRNKSKKDHL